MSDLGARLALLAAHKQTIPYGDLARALNLPSPGAIRQLTAMLEQMMDEDAAARCPFRAAVCTARLSNNMPAYGFFEKAMQLGYFDGSDQAGFVTAQRNALFNLFNP